MKVILVLVMLCIIVSFGVGIRNLLSINKRLKELDPTGRRTPPLR